jgi:hypothetical protein
VPHFTSLERDRARGIAFGFCGMVERREHRFALKSGESFRVAHH